MNLKHATERINEATAILKADNDAAERDAAIRATDPWPDMALVMRERAAARRYVHALALQLKAERDIL